MKMILAIPNGSLSEPTIALLAKLGIRIITDGRRFDARVAGSDIFERAILMRPQDMSEALIDGMVDVAFYGRDWHEEIGLGHKLVVISELDYSKKTKQPVRVVIFSKQDKMVDEPGVLVTTEYPRLTELFFKKATIRFSHGGTEQKVAYGRYDFGICVTETGDSLRENGLAIVKEILISPTLLVAREKNQDLEYFADLLKGALRSDSMRLLKMNVAKQSLQEVLPLLPALESPTISQLSNGDYAVETIVSSDMVADLIINLRGKGASGVLSQKVEMVC